MAIYHLAVKVIGRNKGQSVIAAAAYRSGEKLIDEATGQVKHYAARGERIRFTGIFAPPGAPSWVYDRNRLWNAAEQAETRKDATLAREIVVALPHELTDQARLWLISDFVRDAFVRRGLVADVAIHAPDRNSDSRNFHAHILITERALMHGHFRRAAEFPSNMLLGKGRSRPVASPFAEKKDRSLYSKETLYGWREQWSRLCNRHLTRHGHAARIDHRTLAEQRIDREPTRHLGRVDAQRMRRGVSTVRGDGLRATRLRNALRAVTRAAREIASLPEVGAARGGARTGIRVAAKAAASSMFKPQTKEPHDYSTGKIVGEFLALCHDPLHDLPRWLDTQGRHRSDGDRLFARQGASVACDVGMQPFCARDHASQLIDAATFDGAGGEIAAHSRARPPPERHAADAGGESPHEPCSLEAEVMAITARYAMAIEAARKSGRSRLEIEATILALREQQRVEIHSVTARRQFRSMKGSFTQRYVKRHGLGSPFRRDFEVPGYALAGNIDRRPFSRL